MESRGVGHKGIGKSASNAKGEVELRRMPRCLASVIDSIDVKGTGRESELCVYF